MYVQNYLIQKSICGTFFAKSIFLKKRAIEKRTCGSSISLNKPLLSDFLFHCLVDFSLFLELLP